MHAPRGVALLACVAALCGCRKTKRHKPAPNHASPGAARRKPEAAPPAASSSTQPTSSSPVPAHHDQAPVHVDMPEPPLAPTARPDASGPDANRAIFSDYGFPGFPALTHLCGRRVYEQGGEHLTWDAFSSSATPAELVGYYKKWLGSRGFTAEQSGGTWRIPETAPMRTLAINSSHGKGAWQTCPKQPPAGSRSVIVISRR